MEIKISEKARLVFKGFGSGLIVNPRKRDCSYLEHTHIPIGSSAIWYCNKHKCLAESCDETGMSYQPTRASGLIDESGGPEALWFAFWEEDCAWPAIHVVRAESWEQAYEDFCDSLPDVPESDLEGVDGYLIGDENSNLPDGYSFTSDGRIVYTENVNGREIELVEVTTHEA